MERWHFRSYISLVALPPGWTFLSHTILNLFCRLSFFSFARHSFFRLTRIANKIYLVYSGPSRRSNSLIYVMSVCGEGCEASSTMRWRVEWGTRGKKIALDVCLHIWLTAFQYELRCAIIKTRHTSHRQFNQTFELFEAQLAENNSTRGRLTDKWKIHDAPRLATATAKQQRANVFPSSSLKSFVTSLLN